MNTIEYIRHRGWNEKEITEKFFSSSKGIPVTATFMMEAYADYKVKQALRIHGVVGQSEQLPDDYNPVDDMDDPRTMGLSNGGRDY